MSASSRHDERIPVAVLGATGSVGQRFVALLADHPWFRIAALCASDRSAGKPYGDAVQWVQGSPIPPGVLGEVVRTADPDAAGDCPLVFSALDASIAGEVDTAFAEAGRLVVSNARNHRMERDVPLVVPEINGDHLELVERRQRASGRTGAIVTNPNCSTIGLVLAVKPLVDRFGVDRIQVVTMQAISGAGLPGPSAYQILDNLIPYIPGEEEKIERESRKILGRLCDDGIEEHELKISAQCTRVPVIDGHTLCVSVGLQRSASLGELRSALEEFTGEPQRLDLPSAPQRPLRVLDRPDGPQPRLHRGMDGGMSTVIGRLRPCALLDYKFVVLSHNTLRGAARGALLIGEQCVARGLLEGRGWPCAPTPGSAAPPARKPR